MELNSFVKLDQDKGENEIDIDETEPGVYEIDMDGAPLPEKQLMIYLKTADEKDEAIDNMKITEIKYKTFGIMRKQTFEKNEGNDG